MSASSPFGAVHSGPVQIVGRLEVIGQLDAGSLQPDAIVSRATAMQCDGAGVLELTLHTRDWGDERSGLSDIIRALQDLQLRVAIRTPHLGVAHRAIVAGVDIVDCMDESVMSRVRGLAAAHGTALVVTPRMGMENRRETDPSDRLLAAIDHIVRACAQDGLQVGQIIVAAGADRAIPQTDALLSLRYFSQIVTGGYRVMVNLDDEESAAVGQEQRDAQTIGANVSVATWAVVQGAQLVRAHDVRTAWRAVTMVSAVLDPTWHPASC